MLALGGVHFPQEHVNIHFRHADRHRVPLDHLPGHLSHLRPVEGNFLHGWVGFRVDFASNMGEISANTYS